MIGGFFRREKKSMMRISIVNTEKRAAQMLKGGRTVLNVVNHNSHSLYDINDAWMINKNIAIYPTRNNCRHRVAPNRAGMPRFDTTTIMVIIVIARSAGVIASGFFRRKVNQITEPVNKYDAVVA